MSQRMLRSLRTQCSRGLLSTMRFSTPANPTKPSSRTRDPDGPEPATFGGYFEDLGHPISFYEKHLKPPFKVVGTRKPGNFRFVSRAFVPGHLHFPSGFSGIMGCHPCSANRFPDPNREALQFGLGRTSLVTYLQIPIVGSKHQSLP